jgi:hypothetical protein
MRVNLLFLSLLLLVRASAQDVEVLWDIPIPTNGVTGYQITLAIGTNQPFRTNVLTGITVTSNSWTGLLIGTNYTTTVRSVAGSLLSNPVSTNFVTPAVPANLRLRSAMQSSPSPTGPWLDVTQQVTEIVAADPNKFYRTRLDWVGR